MLKKNILGVRTAALIVFRNIQTTQVFSFRVSDKSWRRGRLRHSNFSRIQLQDSEFPDISEDDLLEPEGNVLEKVNDYFSNLKDDRKRIRKIIAMKTFEKKEKDPNMLTFNERQHMIFLNESDPVEWSADHLSESFPALPRTIKKILKRKWVPDNVEKMKKMDEEVLKNWEKFKNNELVASPALLEHLKKFSDKRDNLKIQLKNPNFFHLPEMKKKLVWKSGPMNSFLIKYEKEIEKLRKESMEPKLLTEKKENNNIIPVEANSVHINVSTVEEEIKEQIELRNSNEITHDSDSFLIGGGGGHNSSGRRRGKNVTLEELKEKTFKETESLSPYEEIIIRKTLNKNNQSESVTLKSNSAEEFSYGKNYGENGEKLRLEVTEKSLEAENSSIKGKRGRKSSKIKNDKTFSEEDDEIPYPKIISPAELGNILFGAKEEKETTKKNDKVPEKRTENKSKIPVNYYNTEKDKLVFDEFEKILAQTAFWNSKTKTSTKSRKEIDTAPSPHLSGSIQTYFTYSYPEKIDIPVEKREKGKLYRVKDCYYDDQGKFVYRIPGMSAD